MLKPTELRLGICNRLEVTAIRQALPADTLRWLLLLLLLTLFLVGTNVGIRRVASTEPGANADSDLCCIWRRYLRPANQQRAIATVMNPTQGQSEVGFAFCELGKATRAAFLRGHLTVIELRREIHGALQVV